MESNLNRRDLLRLVSAAAVSAPLALPAHDPTAPLYFTKDEFATLDVLTEIIIPTDDHSPGAHAAGVAAYIDKSVAEAFLPEDKASWRKGLALVNSLAKSSYDKPFLKLSHQQQVALLEQMSGNAKKEKTGPQKFFSQLKETTAFAYYSSSIGIHQEIKYKGNVLLNEFVGYLPTDTLPPLSSL